MSQADVERFVNDLKSNPDLLDQVKAGAGGVASVVGIARSRGYDISIDEARAYIRAQSSRDLSDEQLEAIAGGKGGGGGSTTTSVSTVQSAVNVTTEAAAAETTGVVVAEAVLVFT